MLLNKYSKPCKLFQYCIMLEMLNEVAYMTIA